MNRLASPGGDRYRRGEMRNTCLFASLAVVAACGPTATNPGDDDDDGADAAREIDAGFDDDAGGGDEGCEKIDLLFVIDN